MVEKNSTLYLPMNGTITRVSPDNQLILPSYPAIIYIKYLSYITFVYNDLS